MIKKQLPQILLIFILVISRVWLLFQYTPVVFQQEALLGYRAQLLVNSGVDELNRKYPIIFSSVHGLSGPISTYLVAGSVGIFGLNALTIRLPFVLISLLGLFALYYLIKKLIPQNPEVAWWSIFVFGLSPVHTALSLSPSEWWLYFNLSLILIAGFALLTKKAKFLLAVIFSIILATFIITINLEKTQLIRIFADQFNFKDDISIINSINQMRGEGSFFQPAGFWSRLFYNKTWLLTKLIMNLFNHLKPQFYFADGGRNSVYSATNFGIFLTGLIIPFILGLKNLGKFKSRTKLIIGVLFAVGIIPSIFSLPTPQPEKLLFALIPLTIIVAWGIIQIPSKWKTLLVVLILFNYSFFVYDYLVKEPSRTSQLRCEGISQLVDVLKPLINQYQQIFISDAYCPQAGIQLAYYLAKQGMLLKTANLSGLPYKINFSRLNNLDITNEDNWEIQFTSPTLLIWEKNLPKHILSKYYPLKEETGGCFTAVNNTTLENPIYEFYQTNNPNCVKVEIKRD